MQTTDLLSVPQYSGRRRDKTEVRSSCRDSNYDVYELSTTKRRSG